MSRQHVRSACYDRIHSPSSSPEIRRTEVIKFYCVCSPWGRLLIFLIKQHCWLCNVASSCWSVEAPLRRRLSRVLRASSDREAVNKCENGACVVADAHPSHVTWHRRRFTGSSCAIVHKPLSQLRTDPHPTPPRRRRPSKDQPCRRGHASQLAQPLCGFIQNDMVHFATTTLYHTFHLLCSLSVFSEHPNSAFLPRNVVIAAFYCRKVCLSVRLSVTPKVSKYTSQHIIEKNIIFLLSWGRISQSRI